MKVLFLDFDGVLNNKQHMLATKEVKTPDANDLNDAELFAMKRDIAQQNIWVLGFILDQLPDLHIVISSAWRTYYELESFKELFRIFQLDPTRIIGKTPKRFSSERIHEIHMWLEDWEEVNQKKVDWVAVDDHVIFNLEDEDKVREFLTDGWTGLTMRDAFAIIRHFNPDYKEPGIMI